MINPSIGEQFCNVWRGWSKLKIITSLRQILAHCHGTFLLCKEIAEIARRNTQNELVAAQEKSDFSFNFNCFSQRKAGKVYIFISEGNSIRLWFLKHVSKYLEIWDKTTYRAHVCKFSSADGLNRKLQIPYCLLNIMLRPSRLPGVIYSYCCGWCLWGNSILYKYQVTFTDFYTFLLSSKI